MGACEEELGGFWRRGWGAEELREGFVFVEAEGEVGGAGCEEFGGARGRGCVGGGFAGEGGAEGVG